MILNFNQTKEKTTVQLFDSEKFVLEEEVQSKELSENLLLATDRIIKQLDASKPINEIICYTDKVSYTGMRIVMTTANFLGFAWNIPVSAATKANGKVKKFSKPVIPSYQSEPKITTPKAGLG